MLLYVFYNNSFGRYWYLNEDKKWYDASCWEHSVTILIYSATYFSEHWRVFFTHTYLRDISLVLYFENRMLEWNVIGTKTFLFSIDT